MILRNNEIIRRNIIHRTQYEAILRNMNSRNTNL